MTDGRHLTEKEEWAVYEAVLAEHRHQIDRNWSLTQFFILLHASVVGGAIALLQAGENREAVLLVTIVLVGALGLAAVGVRVILEGKRYYRTLVAKKTLLEARLGLTQAIPGFEDVDVAVYSVGALATRSKIASILRDPKEYARPRLRGGSLTDWARWVMVGFGVFDLVAIIVLVNRLAECKLTWMPCTPLS